MTSQDTKITIIISPPGSGEGVEVRQDGGPTQQYGATNGHTPTAIVAGSIPNPIKMEDLIQKVRTFHMKTQWLADEIDKTSSEHLKILDRTRFPSQFFIDKASIGRLNTIASHTDFVQFAVFFGLEDPVTQAPIKDPKAAGLGKLTCCFVGLDKNGAVLKDHFPATPDRPYEVKPEETWPPPPPPTVGTSFALNDSVDKLVDFFKP